jgi:hypothetical protein
MAQTPASANGLAKPALSQGWCGEITCDWARHTNLLT